MQFTDMQALFLAFREQCIWLRCCYNTYSVLYESGGETKEVLEASAKAFFADLNLLLIEYCLLQVCKITDPTDSQGRANLTVENLNDALRDAELMTDEISNFSNGLLRYRDLVKKVRNRLISHLDKETILAGVPLGEHNQEEVTAFFESLFGYVDAVGIAVGVGPLDFRTTAGPGDVLDLIQTLRKGRPSGHSGRFTCFEGGMNGPHCKE
jgi:hypothetical protein